MMKNSKMKLKEKRIEISKEIDIAEVVYVAKLFAVTAGFKLYEQFMIATAVSELARNIVVYALKGEIVIKIINKDSQKGIEVIAEDNGPGIQNIHKAMEDYFSTGNSLGLGLPGVKRLMDDFVIDLKWKVGTKITVRKWV